MKVGDFVCYAKEAPENRNHCGVWFWDHGLLLGYNAESKTVDIMTDGVIYSIRYDLVSLIEAGHWHPGMQIEHKS